MVNVICMHAYLVSIQRDREDLSFPIQMPSSLISKYTFLGDLSFAESRLDSLFFSYILNHPPRVLAIPLDPPSLFLTIEKVFLLGEGEDEEEKERDFLISKDKKEKKIKEKSDDNDTIWSCLLINFIFINDTNTIAFNR